ncbi:MAG: hypothetical protein ACR2MP_05640 [Streptosporangiaceae bacterium]
MTTAHTIHCGSTGPADCPDCAHAAQVDTLRLLAAKTKRPTPAKSSPGEVRCGEDLAACSACGLPLRLLHGWPVDGSGGIDCPAGGLHDISTREENADA